MKERDELKNFKGSVITTHKYLMTMDERRLKEYDTVIIDEDIIFKNVISNQGEITISKLNKLLLEINDARITQKVSTLLKMAKTQSCIELEGFELDVEDLEHMEGKISKSFDLISFCSAKHYYIRRKSKEKNLKEDTVSFLKPTTFKKIKYIIVSATCNEKIYHYFFGEGNVDFYKCTKAEYQGTLYQYPGKSMSRTCLANKRNTIQNLMQKFNINRDRVITFKQENIGSLYFGNTEGSNTLEGKDILVVGTPYHTEFLYKLTAFSMGLDFDEDEVMTSQIVTHNGYRFMFTTYKNENLRNIQFWMLESELEQAAGRARLLRKNCEVHLFSNFPLSQSKMVLDFNYNVD